MTIDTRDALVSKLGNQHEKLVWDKASIATQVAGTYCSLWRATGIPTQAAIPAASAVCTSALAGAHPFTNQTDPAVSYIGWHTLQTGNANNNLEIHDRLLHFGGLVGNVTTGQNTTSCDLTVTAPAAERLGDVDYSDLSWWLEWYTATGATASNATVNVTYGDGTTGNLTAIAIGGTAMPAGRMTPLHTLVTNGKFIRGVNSVTLSASTGTAGNFGITCTRHRTEMSTEAVANKTALFTYAQLGFPKIRNDACLMGLMLCTATSTGTVKGRGKLLHG
ncbi:MAG TPA: hypothetical protein DCK83_06990 [Gallionellaceae bacterium]|nr:hypothetical protein [Gallionellaceae bacterium]